MRKLLYLFSPYLLQGRWCIRQHKLGHMKALSFATIIGADYRQKIP